MLLYSILFEADIKQVSPATKGLYAFVNAYSRLAGPIFRKPLYIEFDPKNTKPILSGRTLYVSPHLKDVSCSVGACHDMLHGITQNIVESFGKFKKQGKQDVAPANETVVSLKYYDSVLKILDTVGIPYDKSEFSVKAAYEKAKSYSPANPTITRVDKQQIISKILRSDLQALKNIKISFEQNLDGGISALLDKLLPYFGKNYYEVLTYDPEKLAHLSKDELIKFANETPIGNSNVKTTNNATHAIEEMVGNVFSDNFREALENSEQVDIKAFMDFFKADFDTINIENSDSVEFPIGGNQMEIAHKQKAKWKEYLLMVLPLFLNEYNRQIQILKASKFGAN